MNIETELDWRTIHFCWIHYSFEKIKHNISIRYINTFGNNDNIHSIKQLHWWQMLELILRCWQRDSRLASQCFATEMKVCEIDIEHLHCGQQSQRLHSKHWQHERTLWMADKFKFNNGTSSLGRFILIHCNILFDEKHFTIQQNDADWNVSDQIDPFKFDRNSSWRKTIVAIER